MASKIPSETVTRPMRLSPDLVEFVESELGDLDGDQLKAAQDAILNVHGDPAQSSVWRDRYHVAVRKALDPDYDQSEDPYFDAAPG